MWLLNPYRFGPPLWTPANTTTTLWLDAADAGTTNAVSGKLLSWTDKSSSGDKSAVATTTGPNFLPNALNGLPGLEFTGLAAQALALVDYVYSLGTTIAIVARHNTNSVGQIFSSSLQAPARQIRFEATGGEVQLAGASPGANLISAGQTTGVYYIIVINAPASGGQIFINGTNATASGAAPASSYAFNQIGRRGGNSEPLNGVITETFWMPTSNNTLLRQQAEGYLGHKWGLAANLPSDHPFKDAPPTV